MPIKRARSFAFRIPTSAFRDAGYQLEQKVELVVSRGRIIIQPLKRAAYDLYALVNGINAANAHGEVDFGTPVGKEAL